MSYKNTDRRTQSLLGRAAYNSLSPNKPRLTERLKTFQAAPTPKFRTLSNPSNRNQMIIKEMITTEQSRAKKWMRDSMTNFRPVRNISHQLPNNPLYEPSNSHQKWFSSANSEAASHVDPGDIQNNLRLLGRPTQSVQLNNPQKFLKTQVRTRSFDPILGHENQYYAPSNKLRTLGFSGHDSYNINGFFRHPTVDKFQQTLRAL